MKTHFSDIGLLGRLTRVTRSTTTRFSKAAPHPTPMIGPVNAARGLFMRTKASSLVNHHHQVSEHVENDVRGKSIATWSLGCLCDLHPMYSRYNRWSHGYAEVTLSLSGEFVVSNIKV